jgi:hypothetical protein
MFLVGLSFIPESPVYLLAKGHKKRAGKALMWLRGAETFNQIELELTNVSL